MNGPLGSSTSSGKETAFGLASPSLGLGVGAAITENIWLDGRLAFGTSTRSVGSGPETTTSTVALHAIPAYVFDGDDVRPYVGLDVGYEHDSAQAGGTTVSGGAGVIGPVLGARWFAADSFSIDPALAVFYEAGKESIGDLSADRSGFGVTLGVAISGWLGGAPAKVSPSAAPEVATRVDESSKPSTVPPPVEAAAELPDQTRSSTVDATLDLDPETRLHVAADLRNPDRVSLELVTRLPEGERAACGPLSAKVDERALELAGASASRVFDGFHFLVSEKAHLSLRELARIARGKALVIERCGRTWEVSAEELSPVRKAAKTAAFYARGSE